MLKLPMALCVAGFVMASAPAQAATVWDAEGDFLPTYVGPHLADLDVLSFSVNYDMTTSTFKLSAKMAGDIVPGSDGFYVIGVNTGTGPIAPFGGLGQPNVKFNQAIAIQKTGTGAIGATVLDPSTIKISGDSFSVMVPLSLLPSTGFSPLYYGFNLWPRVGTSIPDFAPENATLAAVPEPATWALMIAGFALIGTTLRRRRVTTAFA